MMQPRPPEFVVRLTTHESCCRVLASESGHNSAVAESADCSFTPAADTRHEPPLRLGVSDHHRPHGASPDAGLLAEVTRATLASSSMTGWATQGEHGVRKVTRATLCAHPCD